MLKVGEVKAVSTFLSDEPMALFRGEDGVVGWCQLTPACESPGFHRLQP
jgi:hypothetical protein